MTPKRKGSLRAGLYLLLLLVLFLTPACGVRTMIRGQVVDGVTGAPIEGAVVAIDWYDREWRAYVVPLASGLRGIERFQQLTDSDGGFEIPHYSFRTAMMCAYKQGYIAWYSSSIFVPPKTWEKIPEKDFVKNLKDGMSVVLMPRDEHVSRGWHAYFISHIHNIVGSPLLYQAAQEELKIANEFARTGYKEKDE